MELPRIISVDDHVVEPPGVWADRLPAKLREAGPHVRREKGGYDLGGLAKWNPNVSKWVEDPSMPGAAWADVWYYEDVVWPLTRGWADSGYTNEDPSLAVTYDRVLPGTYDPAARVIDMDANHTDVSICFPTIPRFCGQLFMNRKDMDVALLCVKAYNDWMIEEWTAGPTPKRLVPLTLVPLWDPELAAAEVRRCADLGSHAIAFTECPPYLGLPSIYTDHWDPLFQACQDTDTVVNMHIGSSSKLVITADDGPTDVIMCLSYINAMLAFTDWLYSGTLELFPDLRIALSESQVGWMPFATQRIDGTWEKGNEKFESRADGPRRAKDLPSLVVPGRVFGCVFDDLEGLRRRDEVGIDQILFETDYPHTDSTFPHSRRTLTDLVTAAGLSEKETYKVVRGNAIAAFGLDTYFGITN